MDYDTGDVDFERAAMLLSVVKDCAGVGPQLTAIGAAAMHELTDMNRDLADRQADAGKAKLRAEQERASELNAKAQADAEKQAQFEEDQRKLAVKTPQPITIMPGEPVPPQVTNDAPIYPSNQDETNDVRRI